TYLFTGSCIATCASGYLSSLLGGIIANMTSTMATGICAAAGTMAAVPVIAGGMGFGGAGIIGGSWAAWLMSYFAVANGGGVAAGGLVATLQALGAAGYSWTTLAGLGTSCVAAVAKVIGG
ncbi:unnamed protein product, partial [Meganyctiphanes norvegica]